MFRPASSKRVPLCLCREMQGDLRRQRVADAGVRRHVQYAFQIVSHSTGPRFAEPQQAQNAMCTATTRRPDDDADGKQCLACAICGTWATGQIWRVANLTSFRLRLWRSTITAALVFQEHRLQEGRFALEVLMFVPSCCDRCGTTLYCPRELANFQVLTSPLPITAQLSHTSCSS